MSRLCELRRLGSVRQPLAARRPTLPLRAAGAIWTAGRPAYPRPELVFEESSHDLARERGQVGRELIDAGRELAGRDFGHRTILRTAVANASAQDVAFARNGACDLLKPCIVDLYVKASYRHSQRKHCWPAGQLFDVGLPGSHASGGCGSIFPSPHACEIHLQPAPHT